MPDDGLSAYLQTPRNATLATLGHGRIHAVPVWFRYEAPEIWIITERGSVKHRNAAHSGRATLCIDDGKFGYVSVEGPVSVRDSVTYDERLALHTLYRGAEAAKRIVDQGGHERMVMLVLRPERWIDKR
ncbi:MAG: pyridoxamine 5'-phosphate oxidase family protein [Chloroflexota bacterium]